MTDEELPDMIKKAFKDFELYLLKVITTMNDCKPNSKHFADRARLVYKRSELKAAATQCGNDVDSALSIFQAKLQIDLFKTLRDLWSAVSPHATLIATLNSISASFLPCSPSIFYGRSVEVDHVVDLVLNHAPARVAIVGSGGIGKTSIALTAIHHPEVEKYFLNQRFFLSCEAVITADSLALELLKLFSLSADSSGSRSPSDILVSFAQSMTSKCLLCLDNFETPWDSDKDHVELLLEKIAVPHLTLIITSRDSDRPRGIKWTAPLLPPIQPLTIAAAVETWDAISHDHDDFSILLINAVDCIPLAVTLLSQLAESESAEALWASWETESTKLVKSDGSAHRLNNLELSIELSLQGPRLRACPGALDFFMILCMLPQGLPESRIPEFETAFRDHFGGTRSAIRVLKQSALDLHTEANDEFGQANDLEILGALYIRLNRLEEADQALQSALGLFTEVNSKLGQAHALQTIGMLFIELDQLGDPEQALQAALNLHTEVNDKLGQANDNRRLGALYTRLNRFEEAERALQSALDLHTEVNSKLGQANDLQRLGDLYTRLDRLKEAERALQSALNLHTEVNAKVNQGNDLQSLGELYTRLNRLEEAEQALQSALNVNMGVGSSLGQGAALAELGNLCITQCRFTEAQDFLARAMDEYGHAHSSDRQQWVEELFKRLRETQYQIIPEPHEPVMPIDDTP
ncbi:hypothetical protein DFH09DRAFT_1041816 [Mycena vulgaris]|nr:hypothetical protein DFH09DRAFT_1041816 [Mycena vulgaris]